jgi:signal transduction histidine kinase
MDDAQENGSVYRLTQWSIVGRLTASLFHEINNPMQAIHGAISLAIEDMADPAALESYLQLSQRESERVINLIARARRIFAVEDTAITLIDINTLLREIALLTAKEMSNRRIKLNMQLAPALLPFAAQYNDLALAFLCPLLTLTDLMTAVGEHNLGIVSAIADGFSVVEFSAPTRVFPDEPLPLPVCRPTIARYRGQVRQLAEDERQIIRIMLPLSPHE